VTLQNLKLIKTADKKPAFSVEMKKEGNAIPYGDFEILSVAASGGDSKVIGAVNGVSSYLDSRTISYPLTEAPIVPGKMIIQFKKPVSDGGDILSKAETDIK